MKLLLSAVLFPLLLVAQKQPYPGAMVKTWADSNADEYGVPRELVYALIDVESGWHSEAVSETGAVGLMQLMPYTALRFGGINRFDALDNLRTGIRYLAWLLAAFDGDLRLAVAAFYAGESRVANGRLHYRSVDVNGYVRRVASRYYQHRLKALDEVKQEGGK